MHRTLDMREHNDPISTGLLAVLSRPTAPNLIGLPIRTVSTTGLKIKPLVNTSYQILTLLGTLEGGLVALRAKPPPSRDAGNRR